MNRGVAAPVRFWTHVDKTDSCWLWTGKKTQGYGRFFITEKRAVQAHRYAYELLVGPILPGLTIDHLCRVHNCVNPAHMEPVTKRINTLRGIGISAEYARRTACKYGHQFTEDNTIYHHGFARKCKTCATARLKHES